jgi:hypothetical protein
MLLIVTFLFLLSIIPFILLLALVIKKRRENKTFGKTLVDIQNQSPFRKNDTIRPKNDFLMLSKENQQEEDKVTKLGQEKKEAGKIVGLAEPQGFWSKFVMSQKMGFLLARMNSQDKSGGFWANLIKAQDMSQGKDKGRGR